MGGLGKGTFRVSVRRVRGGWGKRWGGVVAVNTHDGRRDTEGMETAVLQY